MSGIRGKAKLAIVGATFALAAHVHAQQAIETYHVQGNVHVLVGAGANVAVQVGEDGVLVVDTGAAATREALLAAIRQLSDGPIRWIVNTSADLDHTGGNETVSQAGMTVNGNPAAIISHENVLARMTAANRPVTEMPLNTFFEAGRDFFFNGEAVFLYHVPGAHSDGDIVVYFRGSDVLVAGDMFVTTHYPVIDLEAGGGVDGFMQGLNTMLDIAVPAYLQEGGTYVIPGHGRVGDEADLLTYRDMIFIVRARIADLIKQGKTLEQVKAAKPALDYDLRYGTTSANGRRRSSSKPSTTISKQGAASDASCRPSSPRSSLLVGAGQTAVAQRAGTAAQTPRSSAPVDLTGYWVAVVNEDWRHRMATPRKGDFESLPLNAEGRRVANEWDLAADNAAGLQCKAFGVGGLMRQPGRLHITWADDDTLQDRVRCRHANALARVRHRAAAERRADVAGLLARRMATAARRQPKPRARPNRQ